VRGGAYVNAERRRLEDTVDRITRREFIGISAAGGFLTLGSDPAHLFHRRNQSEGGRPMPLYLSRFSYTPTTWAKLIKSPEDRRAAAKQYIEGVGGKLHGFWYAFGEHDGYNLWEAPDNVSMAATVLAINAGGALSSIQTTALLTVEETLAALKKASSIKYRPPGGQG
jgi:uncharacterized protein with GYD domain